MRDSERNQILEACSGNKSAAAMMRFFQSVHGFNKRDFPDDKPDSPRLHITYTYRDLQSKLDSSRSTIYRSVKLLAARGFIQVISSIGDSHTYQINEGAIAKWLQPMDLFEQDRPVSNDTGTRVKVTRGVVSKRHGYPCQSDTGPPYIHQLSPSSSPSGVAEDEQCQNQRKVAWSVVPHHAGDTQDNDRQELIDQCEELGINPKHTESLLLARCSRQTVKAAIAHLNVRLRRGDRLPGGTGGFIIDFCQDPSRWEHGMDEHGCWVPLRVLVARRKAKAKVRDQPVALPAKPKYDPNEGRMAWESLTADEQTEIQEQVYAKHTRAASSFIIRNACEHIALERKRHGTSKSTEVVDVQPRPEATGDDRWRDPCQDIRSRSGGTCPGLLQQTG